MSVLFDERAQQMRLGRMREDPSALFLHERAFADVIDRLADVRRPFERVLLFGAPNSEWHSRLGGVAGKVTSVGYPDAFRWQTRMTGLDPGVTYDLIVAIGILELLNQLPTILALFRSLMSEEAMLTGAVLGGDSLPQLRAAMSAADKVVGAAAPRVHPRIDGSTLASLLGGVGLIDPVVEIDRVNVRYRSLCALVGDLRAMGATNVLAARSRRPLTPAAARKAADVFQLAGDGERTTESFEILHFAAWSPGKVEAASR